MCVKGNRRLRNFCQEHCPEAILKPEGALFLFEDVDEAGVAAANVEKLGVPMSWLSREQIHGYEPWLSSTILRSGFLTQIDCPFGAKPILDALVRINEKRGAILIASARPLPELRIERLSCGWLLSDGVVTVTAASVVLCAGVLNPLLLKTITGRNLDMKIQRSFIGVFHAPITRRIVRIDVGDSPMMLCPFPGGTTVNMEESDVASHVHPELEPVPYIVKEFEIKLRPVLRLAGGEKLHFYTCEKLNNTQDDRNPYPLVPYGSRHYFWTDEGDGLYSFYPGKFVAVPVACEDLASKLIKIPSVRRTGEAERPAPLCVPELPMYSAPTHVVAAAYDEPLKIVRL